jgi:hypothetical protein
MGRLLTTPPGVHTLRIEKLSALYAAPLIVLAVGAAGLSALVEPFLGNVLAPAVTQYYANAGIVTDGTLLANQLGAFPVWSIFIVMVLAVVVPLLLVKVQKPDVRPIYLCGEQLDDGAQTVLFRAAAEQSAEVQTGGHYFVGQFGEAVLNRWVNPIAIALIIIALGVTAL